MSILDLGAIARRVEKHAARIARYEALLSRGGEGEPLPPSPFDDDRELSGKAILDALRLEGKNEGPDALLARQLARWSFGFLLARVVDEPLRDAVTEARVPRIEVILDAPERLTPADARRRLVLVRTDEERGRLFRALDAVRGVDGPFREVFARRVEARRRADVPAPDVQFAHAFLDATGPLFVDLARRAGSPAAVVREGLAFGAGEGFSARLAPSFFADALRALAPAFDAKLFAGLELAGPSSFVRAFERIGRARRRASRPSHVPFALFFDPEAADRHRAGALYASLPLLPSFHERALGLARGRATEEARLFTRAAFYRLRQLATRVALADDLEHGETSRERFRERTAGAFGRPLEDGLAFAWPEPRIDERARALAALLAFAEVKDLERHFDEDWFRNPRAHAALDARFRTPVAAEEAGEPFDAAPLARFFEGAIA